MPLYVEEHAFLHIIRVLRSYQIHYYNMHEIPNCHMSMIPNTCSNDCVSIYSHETVETNWTTMQRTGLYIVHIQEQTKQPATNNRRSTEPETVIFIRIYYFTMNKCMYMLYLDCSIRSRFVAISAITPSHLIYCSLNIHHTLHTNRLVCSQLHFMRI